jgi:hypothetical protein
MSGSPFGIGEFLASEKATEAQTESAANAMAIQKQMYEQTRADLAPYTSAGTNALDTYQKLMGGDKSAFYQSPDYNWTRKQGLQGIQRAASASGRLASGDYLKDATKYAEGLASTEWNNFMNRYQGLIGYGQAAAAGQAAANQGYGNSNALTQLYSGQAQAAGILGQANTLSNQMGNAGNQVGNYLMQTKPWNQTQAGYNYSAVPAAGYQGWGGADYLGGSALSGADMAYMAAL